MRPPQITPPQASLRRLFAGLVLLALPSFLWARFSEDLNAEQRQATGLSTLSADQVATIDALVQRELTLAKQGQTKGFTKTFTTRRTEGELNASGLKTLTPEQRGTLDRLVADQFAPPPSELVRTATPIASIKLPSTRPYLEVHGSVSLFVGGDFKGNSFYGGALETWLTNRSGTFQLGFGYSEIHSDGMPYPCYGPGYPYGGFGYPYTYDNYVTRRDPGLDFDRRSQPRIELTPAKGSSR